MRRPLPALVTSAGLVAASVAMFSAANAAEPASFAAPTFAATLLGGNEVPPVTTTAAGTAIVTVDRPGGRVCTSLRLENLQVAGITAMHVHQGAAGANGPVVVPFTPGQRACADDIAATVIEELLADPGGHYVNLHTAANPAGEIRGQLAVPEPPRRSTTTTTTTAMPDAEAPAPVRQRPRFTG